MNGKIEQFFLKKGDKLGTYLMVCPKLSVYVCLIRGQFNPAREHMLISVLEK